MSDTYVKTDKSYKLFTKCKNVASVGVFAGIGQHTQNRVSVENFNKRLFTKARDGCGKYTKARLAPWDL